MTVSVEKRERITLVTLDRESVRNAVDATTAALLAQAFVDFDNDTDSDVAVLYGRGDSFCAGADLKAIAAQEGVNRLSPEGDGPMGPSRQLLSKPVIAAISGYAVAGGLELALWCDLRVAECNAVMGVFCRRWGVPLIDGGTVRLPRLIGHSRALDLILTGRPVDAEEAFAMGLVNRVVAQGAALDEALALAKTLCDFPQQCLRNDRLSVYEQWDLTFTEAMKNEFQRGMAVVDSQETQKGAESFRAGAGRHGHF